MSQLDDLLARSQAPGRFVERRRFTLSREKAIEKQREFALRHPRQYILELIQAAVFAGATYIAIDVRPQSCLVAWVGGTKIEARELESLLDYLFADRTDRRQRHLVQLAVGVNALLQRRPRTLRIETGDGSSAIRMDLDAQGAGTVGVPEDAIGGTYLYAEFASGWMSRFASAMAGGKQTEEQKLVEVRCLYTPVPILLNGSAPFGYRGSRHIEIFGARSQRHFDSDGRRGVVAIHSSSRAATGFRMVVGGVWISTLDLDEIATRSLVGVVCDDGLRKTADHSDIVQDYRYQQMLHAVQPHANDLLQEVEGRSYTPPKLPTPEVPEAQASTTEVEEVFEPLPDVIDMLPPRLPTTLGQLQEMRVREAGSETPLFFCTPQTTQDLQGGPADPSHFPYRILVLTPGQVRTLEKEVPDATLHRLSGKADVDFVRRVLERQTVVREHRFTSRFGTVCLRLHLEGRPPDWGEGRPGVPFCVVEEGKTRCAGLIDGHQVKLTSLEDLSGSQEQPTTYRLGNSLYLPGVSVLVEVANRSGLPITDDLVGEILAEAWHVAVPDGSPPHTQLLCALLGQLAVPQLQTAPQVQLGASLPIHHPDTLRHVPLVETDKGPLSLAGLLDLMGTDGVVELKTAEAFAQMESLERRCGYGHLIHPTLTARPVYGVGRIGDRWAWMDERKMWSLPALSQLIWVASTLQPRRHDEHWEAHESPGPELVAVSRRGTDPSDWESGWTLLYQQLLRMEIDDRWDVGIRPPLTLERAQGMGRRALLRMAVHLGHTDQPLLLPSDGGARRSIDEIRQSPYARVLARTGVEMAEAWTFLFTRDELAIIDSEETIGLRYDDPPDVWRSLKDGPDAGWLIRQEVRQAGLSGWLGLRFPYDGTTGILVRTTGRLVAIPQMDQRIPCHGLLWPDGSGSEVTEEQIRLLQLAGLRLYQEVLGRLRTGMSNVEAESARLYGWTFAKYASRNRRLSGTALDFARLIEVKDPDGQVWGSLEEWLKTPADTRPPAPEAVVIQADPTPPTALTTRPKTEEPTFLQSRLHDALGVRELRLHLTGHDDAESSDAVSILAHRSHREAVTLSLNQQNSLIRAALGRPGPEREILLLEMARQLCGFLQGRVTIDLLKCQQVLLAQRLEAR
jgi:hypothetical protein